MRKYFRILVFVFFWTLAFSSQSQDILKKPGKKVIIFYSPDCPVCESYVARLNTLYNTYQTKGFSFFSVFPGTLYTDQEIKAFYQKYKFKPEQINDPKKVLTAQLNAKVTPQVFVVDENGMTLYSGAIDDQYAEIGIKRTVVSKDYLRPVLEAINNNKPLPYVITDPIGCLIE